MLTLLYIFVLIFNEFILHYRQYWLVMSVPCILIEDCPCVDKNPYYTHVTIRNRQVVYTYPELAKQMGLSSSEEAGRHLREIINSIKDNELLDREEITFRVAAYLPHQSLSSSSSSSSSLSGGLSVEQLRTLVKPVSLTKCSHLSYFKHAYVINSC